jgi:hypothetical protein
MTAIVAVMVLSENRVEGLVRPVYRGRPPRRFARRTGLQTPLRWGTPRFRGDRTNIKNILGNGNSPSYTRARQPAKPRLGGRRGFQIVSIPADGRLAPNRHKPANPRQQAI